MPSSEEVKAATELFKQPQPVAATAIEPVGESSMSPARQAESSIEQIIHAAVQAGRSGADMSELLAVWERVQARKSAAAFNEAFELFQSSCPAPPRTAKADYVTDKGGRVKYDYADVEQIRKTVKPYLHHARLSVGFGDSVVADGVLTETAILRHVGGHSTSASFSCTLESRAGMSPQQKYGNASTYCQRRALSKVLGIWTGDPDDDGRGLSDEPEPTLNEVQIGEIRRLLASDVMPPGTESGMLNWLGVEKLEDVPAGRYQQVLAMLNKKLLQLGATL